jgi:DNA polymerase III gamma/tau subunit
MQLHEQFRPKTWADVVGQDKALSILDNLRQRSGLSGRAYFISGGSGTGKTTIARLIAAEVSESWATTEIDGSQVNSDLLAEIERARRIRPFGKLAYIINECHLLRGAMVSRLLVLIETLPEWLTIIFTTTTDGAEKLFDTDDASPFLSRCEAIQLARRDLAKPFAERARTIAQSIGLDGKPIEEYIKLAQSCKNNFRAMLQRIEAGAMLDRV